MFLLVTSCTSYWRFLPHRRRQKKHPWRESRCFICPMRLRGNLSASPPNVESAYQGMTLEAWSSHDPQLWLLLLLRAKATGRSAISPGATLGGNWERTSVKKGSGGRGRRASPAPPQQQPRPGTPILSRPGRLSSPQKDDSQALSPASASPAPPQPWKDDFHPHPQASHNQGPFSEQGLAPALGWKEPSCPGDRVHTGSGYRMPH